MAGALKRTVLFLLTFVLLTIASQTVGAKTLRPDVYAACAISYAFSMTSQDGTYTLLFFNDPRAAGQNPQPYAGEVFSKVGPTATSRDRIMIDPKVSTTYSIAKISSTSISGASYHQQDYSPTQNVDIDCGTININPIPYDASKDPFPKGKYFQIYLDAASNTFKCREITTPTQYASLSECELAAKSQPPIKNPGVPGGGIPIGGGTGGSAKAGDNPCKNNVCETALGTIPTDPQAFATKILAIGTGLGGAFAFILMVIGSIRVLTSSGDEKGVAAGRDMIVAAVSGLLFLILSTVILRFIGINILGL